MRGGGGSCPDGTRVAATRPVREQLQRVEQRQREDRGRGDVPRPRSHHVQQRVVDGLGTQVHVVAAGDDVCHPDERRKSQRDREHAPERAPAGVQPAPEHEQARRDDGPDVVDEVREVVDARKGLGEIGGQDRLERGGERPEVRQLDEQLAALVQ